MTDKNNSDDVTKDIDLFATTEEELKDTQDDISDRNIKRGGGKKPRAAVPRRSSLLSPIKNSIDKEKWIEKCKELGIEIEEDESL